MASIKKEVVAQVEKKVEEVKYEVTCQLSKLISVNTKIKEMHERIQALCNEMDFLRQHQNRVDAVRTETLLAIKTLDDRMTDWSSKIVSEEQRQHKKVLAEYIKLLQKTGAQSTPSRTPEELLEALNNSDVFSDLPIGDPSGLSEAELFDEDPALGIYKE